MGLEGSLSAPEEAKNARGFESLNNLLVNHPKTFSVRMAVEPGYAVRVVSTFLSKTRRVDPALVLAAISATTLDCLKAGGYGYIIYKTGEYFLR